MLTGSTKAWSCATVGGLRNLLVVEGLAVVLATDEPAPALVVGCAVALAEPAFFVSCTICRVGSLVNQDGG